MVKFLDATEDEVQIMNLTNEELDTLLKAHQIITRERMRIKSGKGSIITGS